MLWWTSLRRLAAACMSSLRWFELLETRRHSWPHSSSFREWSVPEVSDCGLVARCAAVDLASEWARDGASRNATKNNSSPFSSRAPRESRDSGPNCAFSSAAWVPLSAVLAAPPSGYTFPQGLFDFTIGGCVAGSTITMTLTFPQPVTNAVYRKYGPTTAVPTPHWYQLPASIVGNTVTFSITDGGFGDDDLTQNGSIADQGGPSLPVPRPKSRPWPPLWLVILGLLAAATGGPRSRRRL